MLEQKELEKTVRLAKIGLSEAEIKLFGLQLTRIVDYFIILKSLNLKEVEATSHVVKINCPRRPDEKIADSDNVLAKMPWIKLGQFFVPIILDALSE